MNFLTFSSAENESSTLSSPSMVVQPRAHELEPLDVATHLHLLGESLSVIGSRLKEQNVNLNNVYLNLLGRWHLIGFSHAGTNRRLWKPICSARLSGVRSRTFALSYTPYSRDGWLPTRDPQPHFG